MATPRPNMSRLRITLLLWSRADWRGPLRSGLHYRAGGRPFRREVLVRWWRTRMDTQVLGLIGVGRMGGPMAGRLLDAGYSLRLFDTSEEALAPLIARGAYRAGSPADVGSGAEIVLLSLPTPDIVEKVVLGPGGLVEGTGVRTIVDLSTSGPAMEKKLAAALAPRG